MTLCPFASIRLIDRSHLVGNGLPMAAYNRVNLHIQAGFGSLANYFNQDNRPSSHFWVAQSGLPEQYVDTALRAEADLQGNDATISIETEGNGAWTPAQKATIIQLVQWIMNTHGIPVQLATSSQIGAPSKGLSWHRLGINGNFPALPSRYAGRLQRGGGMLYSTSSGKACPIETNIDAIYDEIFPGLVGQAANPLPPVEPPVTPPPPPPPAPKVQVDGYWGSGTTAELQTMFGTPRDGEIWGQYRPNGQAAFTSGWVYNYPNPKGSALVRAMQHWLNVNGFNAGAEDGIWGAGTTNALQRRYGTNPAGTQGDGKLDAGSLTVKKMQEAINRNAF